MLTGDGACRIPEDLIPRLELGRGRLPSTSESLRKQLRGRWPVIPHGDRRDGAESRRVEDEKVTAIEWQDHIVCVLVLGDDLDDRPRRLLLTGPLKDRRERVSCAEGVARLGKESLGDGTHC